MQEVNLFLLNYFIQNERERRQKDDEVTSLLKVLISQREVKPDKKCKREVASISVREQFQSSDKSESIGDDK